MGIIWADRFYNKKPIIQRDLQLLIEFSQYIASAIQITKLYEQLSLTKEYLKSLIDNSPYAIATYDPNGLITSWNKGAEQIFGFTEQEAMGKLLPEPLIDNERELFQKVMKGEVIKDVEALRREERWCIHRSYPCTFTH